MNRTTRTCTRGVVMAVIALAAGAVTAIATPTSAQAAPARMNCVADLTGRASTQCFATLTEAMTSATGGRLIDAPATGAKALADPAFVARVDASNQGSGALRGILVNDIVISIEYDLSDHDETGGTLIWKGDKECTTRITDVDYEIANYNVSAPAWVNRITSFQTFGNCWTKHFEDPGLDGASVGFQSSRTYIGAAMDNRTSSQQWS